MQLVSCHVAPHDGGFRVRGVKGYVDLSLCDGKAIGYVVHIIGLTGIKSRQWGGRAGWVTGHICICQSGKG